MQYDNEYSRRLAEYHPATEEIVDLVLDSPKFHTALSEFIDKINDNPSARQKDDIIRNFAIITKMIAGIQESYLVEEHSIERGV
jgi:hypothetical protein